MKTTRRTVYALAAPLAIVLMVGMLLELANVVRLATDRADSECDIVTMQIARQLELLKSEQREAPVQDLAPDPRLRTALTDAISYTSSILAIGVYDTAGIAVAHTVENQMGTRMDSLPPLPVAQNLLDSVVVLWDLWRSGWVYALSTPLSVDDRPFATIQVSVFSSFLWDRVRVAFLHGVTVSVVIIALTLGTGLYLSRRALDRLRSLEASIRAIRAGHFDGALPVTGADAFSNLAQELNLLAEQFKEMHRYHGTDVFERTADSLADGIIALGPDNEVLVANDVACLRLDLAPDSIVGRRIDESLGSDHPISKLCTRLRETRERSLRVRLGEGDDPNVLIAVGHRIDNPHRKRAGILIEIKEHLQQAMIRSLVNQSRILDRYKEIAAGMAHELRGPLQNLTFDISTLLDSAETDDTRSRAQSALHGVGRLDRAINGFLKIARMRAPALEELDSREFIEELADRLRPEANLAGMELDLEMAPSLPAIVGDREALGQAIENLVRNAAQALPSRSGRITLRAEQCSNRLRISVIDSGPGIASEAKEKVFHPFYTTREKGSGIGLPLVRQTVEALGGDVVLDTSPACGTTVTIQLPAVEKYQEASE